jgi:eukaryotic-like serine/threonine-protein kinase
MTNPITVGGVLHTDAAHYEVLSLIGRGGMGEVYRGRQAALERDVAIKVLTPGSDSERFLREARTAAKVKSEYAVSVFDFQVLSDGRPIIVMEYVDGGSLLTLSGHNLMVCSPTFSCAT